MRTLFILIIAVFVCSPAFANTPKKQPLVKYSALWTNSPFTSKPPVEESAPPVNPFEDYILTGIAPVPGGHRITILSRTNPEMKRIIEPGGNDGFKVVSVNRNPEIPLGTTVVLSSGSVQGTVTFEPDLITLQTAPNAQANPENNPPIANPPPNEPQPNPGMRIPRPRIIPASPSPSPAGQTQQNQPSQNRRDPRR